MKTLLLVVGFLAAVPLVSAATIAVLVVEARSGDVVNESCEDDPGFLFCNAHSEQSGSVAAFASANSDFVEVAAYFARWPSDSGPLSARTFASFAASYLPPANGYAVFDFEFREYWDNEPTVRAEFNGQPFARPGRQGFAIPVRGGVPFSYVIELEASGFQSEPNNFPGGYSFSIAAYDITFVHTPEPSTTATLLLTSCFCLLWRMRRESTRRARLRPPV